jgi:hypothetical protein
MRLISIPGISLPILYVQIVTPFPKDNKFFASSYILTWQPLSEKKGVGAIIRIFMGISFSLIPFFNLMYCVHFISIYSFFQEQL